MDFAELSIQEQRFIIINPPEVHSSRIHYLSSVFLRHSFPIIGTNFPNKFFMTIFKDGRKTAEESG